jgi:hypothetical protein
MGTVRMPIFRLRSALPQERQIKIYKPGFPGDLRSVTGLYR